MLASKILRILNIKEAEWRKVLLCVFFAFFVGFSQSYCIIAPLSLFLTAFQTTLLPYIYIASSALTLLSGLIYSYFAKRTKLITLMFSVLAACSISLFVFWILLVFTSIQFVILALIVSGWVIFGFCNMIVTLLINYIFTFEQGKRLYGLFSSAVGSGGIVAGLLSPVIVSFVKTQHIIAVASIGLAIALYLLSLIKSRYFVEKFESSDSEEELSESFKKSSKASLFRNPYLLLVFLFAAFNVFEYYSLDMLFNNVAKLRYPNEEALTSFLGVFFSLCDFLILLIGLVLYKKLNEKAGIIVSLLLLPLIVASLTTSVLFFNILLPNFFTVIFVIVVLMRLLDESLRASVYEQVIFLLFQPLKSDTKIWAQAKVETFVVPAATGIIGVVLLLFSHFYGTSLTTLAFIVLACSTTAALLLIPIKDKFKKALKNALQKRQLMQFDLSTLDKITIEQLQGHLKSGREAEIVYVLSIFERHDTHLFLKELAKALNHPSPQLQKYALTKMIEYQSKDSFDRILTLAKQTDDTEVKSLALIGIGIQHSVESDKLLIDYLHQDDLPTVISAIIGLTKFNSESQEEGIARLNHLLQSEKAAERIAAATIIEQNQREEMAALLLPLLNDPEPSVRIAASKAAIPIMNKELFTSIANNLVDSTSRASHLTHLFKSGEKIIPLYMDGFNSFSKEVMQHLIHMVHLLNHEKLIPFLFVNLSHCDPFIRHQAISALSKYNFNEVPDEETGKIIKQLSREKSFLKGLIPTIDSLAPLDETKLLTPLLRREAELSKERMINLLSCFYSQKQFQVILEAMKSNDEVLYSYAEELLFQSLSHDHRKAYIDLINWHFDESQVKGSVKNEKLAAQAVANILKTKHFFTIPATKAAAIYFAANIKGIAHLEKFRIDKNDPLQFETYDWAIKQMNRT